MDRPTKKHLITLASDRVATALLPTIPKREQLRRESDASRAAEKDFSPILRFAVASDIHINADTNVPSERLEKLFDTAYEFSAKDSDHPTLDAFVVVGDFTDSGSQEQYDIFNAVVNKKLRKETKLITVMGNHEFADLGAPGYLKNMQVPLDQHIKVNGFHFIGLSPKPNDTWHTPSQAIWLEKQIKAAEADDSGDIKKPVFTFQHAHILKTVYVSRSWYTQLSFMLHPIFSAHKGIINFSGHSHGPINNPLTVWQNAYTSVGTGTLRYFEMERDLSAETLPAGNEKAAQYFIVEADKNGAVRILPFNLLTGEFFAEPSNPGKQLIYYIENPRDRKTFAYTAARKKTDKPPRFAPNAKCNASRDGSNLSLTFDQAKSDNCVYGYRIKLFKPGSAIAVRTKAVFSEYYFEPMPERLTVNFDELDASEHYKIKIFPLNVWGKAGKPLVAQI